MDRQQGHADNEMSETLAWSHADAGEDVRHQPSANDHAQFLIQILGPESRQSVAAGATAQFAEWLGWPNWLMHGTSLSADAKLPERILLADDLEAVEDVVAELGGSFSAEHGVGLSKLNAMARRKNPVALDVMRAMKLALDPDNRMNPGKVIPA